MSDRAYDIEKNFNKIIYTKNPFHESLTFGVLLAIVGGFLDAYTYIGRGGVFANAQTGNIVLLGVYASEGKWLDAFIHVPPIAAFILGVIVTEGIKRNSSHIITADWKRFVLALEIIVLFTVGFLSYTVPDIIINVIISFVTSVQVSSFRKLVDSPYATTMCTGNLRSASEAAYVAFIHKDRKSAVTALRYFAIIFTFVIGAFLGGLLTVKLGVRAIWVSVVILLAAFLLYCMNDRKIKQESYQ